MDVRGPNQLNKSRHRLQRTKSGIAIALARSPYLVMDRLDAVLVNLRRIDFSRGPKAFIANRFARNVAWHSRYNFIEYWISF